MHVHITKLSMHITHMHTYMIVLEENLRHISHTLSFT